MVARKSFFPIGNKTPTRLWEDKLSFLKFFFLLKKITKKIIRNGYLILKMYDIF